MLIYNPTLDLHHCLFRMLSIIKQTNIEKNIEIEKLQLLDFYLLFPQQFHSFKATRTTSKFKRIIPLENLYTSIKHPRLLYHQMDSIQKLAINNLISWGFIVMDNSIEGIIKQTEKEIPSNLSRNLLREDGSILTLITKHLIDIPLDGESGLKARSNLIEYRYDSIK
jgi:hypothetical protein